MPGTAPKRAAPDADLPGAAGLSRVSSLEDVRQATDGSFRCCVLASGSTGNAVYVEAGSTALLVDAGVGIRQLQGALREIGVVPDTLDALLVTHEHHDHVRGLPLVVQRFGLPVYTSQGTWSELCAGMEDVAKPRFIAAGRPFALGEMVIEPFALSHDAMEPLGFVFHAFGRKLVLATDLGYVSAKNRDVTRGAHTYIVEANHDVEMLRAGPYPWHLKRRILGDKGHLSNDSAAEYLLDVVTEATARVFLAHLSEENNRPEVALAVVDRLFADAGGTATEGILLTLTHPRAATELVTVCERGSHPHARLLPGAKRTLNQEF